MIRYRHRRSSLVLLAPCAIALSGCVATTPIPLATFDSVGALPSSEGRMPQPTPAGWWRSFQDPVLENLVERGVQSSLDVRIAEARVRAARARQASARAGRLPQILGSAVASDVEGEASVTVDADASWNADLFGGLRAEESAAASEVRASLARREQAELELVADLARGYIDLRLDQARLRLAEEEIDSQRQTAQLVRWREMAGLADRVDAASADALVANLEAGVPDLEAAVREALNVVTALVGLPPGALDATLAQGTIPDPPAQVHVALPADIVRRRFDVQAAEASFAAELARVDARRAEQWPGLSLVGMLTGTGDSWEALSDGLTSQISAALQATLFDGGSGRAAVRTQTAVAEEAALTFETTALQALQQADDALAQRLASEDVLVARNRSLALAEDVSSLRLLQYRGGLTDITALLDAQREAIRAADLALQARASRAARFVSLAQALGGASPDDR